MFEICQTLIHGINQNENKMITRTEEEVGNSKFKNHLLSFRKEYQNTIEHNSHQHPTFLQRYQKIIEIIDWTLERYSTVIQEIKFNNKKKNQM